MLKKVNIFLTFYSKFDEFALWSDINIFYVILLVHRI